MTLGNTLRLLGAVSSSLHANLPKAIAPSHSFSVDGREMYANGYQTLMRLYTGSWRGFYLKGLIMAMCYTVVQDKRGQKSHFFFFQVPAQSIPYCMLLWSMVLNPMVLPLEISGLLAAHLHDFLTRLWPEFGMGPNLLPTPGFISKLVQTPRFMQRDYGTAVQPKASTSGSSTGASTGSVLPDSWKTRGTGHRLG
jgi:Derlin-2/3